MIFLEKLLIEIAGAHAIVFEKWKEEAKSIAVLTSTPATGSERYQVLLFDCGNDDRVASAIRERETSLRGAGYDLILGLRDVYPTPYADFARLQLRVGALMPVSPPHFKMCFAVMEVEAWFLQEEVHFGRISPTLTKQAVVTATGFDWTRDCAELIHWPAGTLNEIYRIAGLRYDKKRRNVERTVQAIDFANLYLLKRGILGSFDRFASEIDSFLA